MNTLQKAKTELAKIDLDNMSWLDKIKAKSYLATIESIERQEIRKELVRLETENCQSMHYQFQHNRRQFQRSLNHHLNR